MSVTFDVNRTSMWLNTKEGSGRLNYSVEDNNAVFSNDELDISNTDSSSIDKVSYFDIKDIDVTNCNFSDFCKVAKFAKTSFSAFDYDECLLDSYKNTFSENESINFYMFFEDERLNCANRGDIKLYYEIQTISQIAQNMSRIYNDGGIENITADGYSVNNVFTDGSCVGSYGNYRLADCYYNFGSDSYEVFAEFDRESTKDNPVVNITIRNTLAEKDMPGKYVVDINTIDYKNATPLELFAYYSYIDSVNNDKWYQSNNENPTFSELFLSGAFEIETISDFTDKQVDLREVAHKAKEIISGSLASNKDDYINLSEINKAYSRELLEKWLRTYDDIILSLGEDE